MKKKTARDRICDIHRLTVLGASLLITIAGMEIKAYFVTMQTADAVAEIRAEVGQHSVDMQQILRNDAKQDQRADDAQKDRDNLRARLDRWENRGGR